MKVSRQVIMQALKQSFCIPIIYIKHGFRLPDRDYRSKINYSLPFEGEWTVINGGIEKEYSHSWNVPTQRYAYDFVMMNDEGKTYKGDNPADIAAYECYGKNVLAPADGLIVKIGNECTDGKIMLQGNVEMTAEDIRGNYIVIEHTDKEYSFIGHMKPGSICVSVGDEVFAEQVIGKCGNTGNSSEPHIHFHVQDGPDFFTAAGVPITFRDISVSEQKGYGSYDNRKIPDIMLAEECMQISRGQRVKNNITRE